MRSLLVVLCCMWSGIVAGQPTPPSYQAGDLVVEGGWLFDGTDAALRPNPDLLIRAGTFLWIGPLPEAGSEVEVLTLTDEQYILPGFFDLHAHYAVDFFGQGRVDETTAYPTLFLGNGVTSTFPAGEIDPVKMRDLRLAIDRGERPGPRLFNSGPYFGRARYGWSEETTAEEIHAEVDYWAAQGARGFKAKRPSPEHLQALIERAHQHGLTVTGHLGSGANDGVNPRDAIRMGIDRIEHFMGGDVLPSERTAYASLVSVTPETPGFDAIVQDYLNYRVYFNATLTAYGYFGAQEPVVFEDFADERQYLTPYLQSVVVERGPREPMGTFETIYEVKKRTLKAFYDAGGKDLITVGTDHPSWGQFFSGFGIHRELHAFTLAGIPPGDALRMATRNSAHAMNVGDKLGTIEPGKWADAVIINGNPLLDIRATRDVQWVVKAGTLYDAPALLESVRRTIGPSGPDEVEAWTHPSFR